MGLIAKQCGMTSGVLGRLAARSMAHNNRDFNQQLVQVVAATAPRPRVVAELGSGPGVGLAALLDAFRPPPLDICPDLAIYTQVDACGSVEADS